MPPAAAPARRNGSRISLSLLIFWPFLITLARAITRSYKAALLLLKIGVEMASRREQPHNAVYSLGNKVCRELCCSSSRYFSSDNDAVQTAWNRNREPAVNDLRCRCICLPQCGHLMVRSVGNTGGAARYPPGSCRTFPFSSLLPMRNTWRLIHSRTFRGVLYNNGSGGSPVSFAFTTSRQQVLTDALRDQLMVLFCGSGHPSQRSCG